MSETSESKITFRFTKTIPTEILTGERLAPIVLSLEGLDAEDVVGVLESGHFSAMASLMSADGRVPMSLIEQSIFGGTTFSSPIQDGDQVIFTFDNLVIRQSGNFRIQFSLIKREESDGPTSNAPVVPLSRHSEVLHVSAFVHERRSRQSAR